MICLSFFFFFFNDTATTEIYTTEDTLSLHDALPISPRRARARLCARHRLSPSARRQRQPMARDRKSTRLNSKSPSVISYAVFCLKKKKKHEWKTKLGAHLKQLQQGRYWQDE